MFELFDTHLDAALHESHSYAGVLADFVNQGIHQTSLHLHEALGHHSSSVAHEVELSSHYSDVEAVPHEVSAALHHATTTSHGDDGARHEIGGFTNEVHGVVEWWKDLFHDFWHWLSPHELVTIGGAPDAEKQYWHLQEGQNSCAVAAQTCVLESILHRHFDESEMARIAHDKGWYSPESGTSPKDVGNLLNEFGIPIERHTGFTLTEIYDSVKHGEKVIVGLNANEIWNPQHGADGKPLHQLPGGHAVWVTGFEMNEEGKVIVTLNDTGTPDGKGSHIAVEDFRNAWSDYSNFAVVTHINGAAHAA